jgi:hypothetical protein
VTGSCTKLLNCGIHDVFHWYINNNNNNTNNNDNNHHDHHHHHFMELSPSPEAASRLATEEFTNILWNPKVPYEFSKTLN